MSRCFEESTKPLIYPAIADVKSVACEVYSQQEQQQPKAQDPSPGL